jgi:xylulokinase
MAAAVSGIDCGAQSTNMIAYHPRTKYTVSFGEGPFEFICPDDGTRAQRAPWWTDALKTSFDQIAPEVKSRIVIIGISGQQHGFVPVDENGEVLFDVKLGAIPPLPQNVLK